MIRRINSLRVIFLVLCFVASSALTGCATSVHGARNLGDVGRYTDLQKAVSTKKDVFISFGQPHDVQYVDGSASLWRYFQAKTSSSAATFIPFVGLVAGGVDSQTLTTTIFFDDQERYQKLLTKEVKKTTNMWTGMSKANALAKDDGKIDRVKMEMEKLRLPYDEQVARSMSGVEIFSED